MKALLFSIIVFFGLNLELSSQGLFYVSGDYNFLRDQNYFVDSKAFTAFTVAFGFPIKSFASDRLMLLANVEINRKGFNAEWNDVPDYLLRMTYLSGLVELKYQLSTKLNASIGVSAGHLINTNINHGKIFYNDFDLQLVPKLYYNITKILSISLSYGHSLFPILEYLTIDEFGTVENRFKDGYFSAIKLGIVFDIKSNTNETDK